MCVRVCACEYACICMCVYVLTRACVRAYMMVCLYVYMGVSSESSSYFYNNKSLLSS